MTGGAGAIGSHLVATLLGRGDRVVVVDDLSSGHEDLVPKGAELVTGSVNDDATLERVIRRGTEVVFHLAALFANQNSVDHPEQDLMVNGLGTLKVFEAAARAGVSKVVYCSSSCVYGARPLMTETAADLWPDTPYAMTKLLGEHYARYAAAHLGLNIAVVRPFNSYGPHEYPGQYRNVIPNFVALALRGRPLVVTGTGEETRDFTYVGDIVSGLLAVSEATTEPAEAFNLASGVETRILALAELVNELTANTAGIEFRPRRDWDHVERRHADISKARERLGFQARTPLEDGLNHTVAWLRTVAT